MTNPSSQVADHQLAATSLERLPLDAANDNEAELIHDGLLHAALRHFAQHGLSAAELAQQRAEAAFFAGNRKEYQHWLEICRTLDRRLAASLARRPEAANAPPK